MGMKFLLGCALLMGTAAWAADPFTPLDVKTGTWEATMSVTMNGMPPIPADVLAKMTPQQRAMVEQMSGGRGGGQARTTTSKSCVKKEDVQNPLAFANDQKSCKPTIVISTPSKEVVKIDCADNQTKSNGTITIEALSSESIKITGAVAATSSDGAHTMNITMNGTSKWVGAACTDK